MAERFAIAAGHDLTAEAGAEVLAAGGTAVDAVVAAAAMAMVAEPMLAGLLGGGFLLHRDSAGRTAVLDAFVTAPRRTRAEGELDITAIEAGQDGTRQPCHIGAGAIAVPGLALGLAEAHARAGRVPLAELLAPAARRAREGVPLGGFQSQRAGALQPVLAATPEVAALFLADDAPPGTGWEAPSPLFGGVHGVARDMRGRLSAAGDIRRDGAAITG